MNTPHVVTAATTIVHPQLEAAYELGESWSQELGRSVDQLRLTVALLESDGPSALEEAYYALSEARLRGKRTVVYRSKRANDPLATKLGLKPFESASGSDWRYFAGTLSLAIHAAFVAADTDAKERIRGTFTKQVERFLEGHVQEFYRGSWARSVLNRTLAREHYVENLQNLHQYVRFTTRLLGRAVAVSPTTALRAHFAAHLRGEVNHEILLERDLRNMGESTEYLLNERYANAPTRTFMVLEQSLAAFEQDSVMFMCAPLAAEAASAHMDGEFLKALRDNAERYGVPDTKKVTTFWSSHIETDGGDDGHWAMTMRVLQDNLESEIRLGEFLSLLEVATSSFTASFNSSVDDLTLFSAS